LKGDEDAWVALWKRYGPLVKALARRAGCTEEEAGEVVQRVGLVAVRNLPTLRDSARLGGWLASTARFQALATIRQRQPHTALDADLSAPSPAADELLIQEERLTLMRQAFVQLDPRCQRVLARLDLQEPAASYQAVATAEGLATSSIGPVRRRCLKRLRRLIQDLSRSSDQTHCTGGG
jgi:RNA polymerase sigma factor (sigma-70 family)